MSSKGIEIVERRHNVAQILLGTLKSVAMEDQEYINDGGLHVKALFRARLLKVMRAMDGFDSVWFGLVWFSL